MSGFVYILTNPSFRDDWVKIGKSSRPVNIRSKELDNTAVPLPFDIYAVMETEKYDEAEKQIHGLIDIVNPDMRIRKGREFFNVTPEKALSIFRQCARTIDDAKIELYENNHPISQTAIAERTNTQTINKSNPAKEDANKSRTRVVTKANLTFELLNIPVGAELSYSENESITATVINNINRVRLQDGTEATLSRAVVLAKRKLGLPVIASEAYQGGKFWLYKGHKLVDIRSQIES